MDSVTTTTSRSTSARSMTWLLSASANSTKANSPPWHRAAASAREESADVRSAARGHSRIAALIPISPTTPASTSSGCATTWPRSADMPTEMKNSPSSRPLKGSMLASSSWRYSESASSTPARKAPSDIDSPTATISSETPMTTSRAAAVKISWMPRVRDRPAAPGAAAAAHPAITATMTATAFACGEPGIAGLRQRSARSPAAESAPAAESPSDPGTAGWRTRSARAGW